MSMGFEGILSHENLVFGKGFICDGSLVIHFNVSGLENSKLFVVGCLYSFSETGNGGVSCELLHDERKINKQTMIVSTGFFMLIDFIYGRNWID